jgi:hypothetical protein
MGGATGSEPTTSKIPPAPTAIQKPMLWSWDDFSFDWALFDPLALLSLYQCSFL